MEAKKIEWTKPESSLEDSKLSPTFFAEAFADSVHRLRITNGWNRMMLLGEIRSAKLLEVVWYWLNISKISEVPNTKFCSPTWFVFWIQRLCGKPEFLKKHPGLFHYFAIFERQSPAWGRGPASNNKSRLNVLAKIRSSVRQEAGEQSSKQKRIRLDLYQFLRAGGRGL